MNTLLKKMMCFTLALLSTLYIEHAVYAQPQAKTTSQIRDLATNVLMTARQSQSGKVDDTRLFIFEITYIPGPRGSEVCSVSTITINNTKCDSRSIGEGKGFWVKAEFEDETQLGKNNFKCAARPLDSNRMELVINATHDVIASGGATFTYRLIKEYGYRGKVLDFLLTLNKNSTITNRIETAEFVPLRGKNVFAGGWENVSLSCSNMTVPMIPPKESQKQ
jgi:hypothetical protein